MAVVAWLVSCRCQEVVVQVIVGGVEGWWVVKVGGGDGCGGK